jgi:hypothetical protein
MTIDVSKLLVNYGYLSVLWGDLKLTRLIKAENPDDLPVCMERLHTAIDAVQSELLGYFGFSYGLAPARIESYVRGILPPFLEYRLCPHAALKAEIDMLLRNMETIHKGQVTVTATAPFDFSMFVV